MSPERKGMHDFSLWYRDETRLACHGASPSDAACLLHNRLTGKLAWLEFRPSIETVRPGQAWTMTSLVSQGHVVLIVVDPVAGMVREAPLEDDQILDVYMVPPANEFVWESVYHQTTVAGLNEYLIQFVHLGGAQRGTDNGPGNGHAEPSSVELVSPSASAESDE